MICFGRIRANLYARPFFSPADELVGVTLEVKRSQASTFLPSAQSISSNVGSFAGDLVLLSRTLAFIKPEGKQ